MGMSACNLTVKLQNSEFVYGSGETVMEKEYLNSQQSLFNAYLVACIVDETHTAETWMGLR